jgi:hypothetical protein
MAQISLSTFQNTKYFLKFSPDVQRQDQWVDPPLPPKFKMSLLKSAPHSRFHTYESKNGNDNTQNHWSHRDGVSRIIFQTPYNDKKIEDSQTQETEQ